MASPQDRDLPTFTAGSFATTVWLQPIDFPPKGQTSQAKMEPRGSEIIRGSQSQFHNRAHFEMSKTPNFPSLQKWMPQTVGSVQYFHNVMAPPVNFIPVRFSHVNWLLQKGISTWATRCFSWWERSGVEEWRYWLEGAVPHFQIITDHKNLEYIKGPRWMNPRQARWSLFFKGFNFTVPYRTGSKNHKDDKLSWSYDPEQLDQHVISILPPSVVIAQISWDIMEEIQRGQQDDPPSPECPPNWQYIPHSAIELYSGSTPR